MEYWDRRPCNVRHSPKAVGSREYFDEVRDRKYFVEPHITRFAGFESWQGKRVLEAGCGIGTDSVSFALAGAQVTAVDLSTQSLALAKQHAATYGVSDRIDFLHADLEDLSSALPPEPYDLIYSFGVLHHTPFPGKALDELRRFTRPNTVLKLMLYHRYSWKVLYILLVYGKGRVFRASDLIARYSEAQTGCPITYTYTRRSASKLLREHGFTVKEQWVDHIFPYRIPDYTQYQYVRNWYWRRVPKPLFRLLERRLGWHLCLTATVDS